MKIMKSTWVAVGAALILAACGGGGGDSSQTPKTSITSVKVFGDSLVDSGTFLNVEGNRIYSVQGATHRNWAEKIAAVYGITSLCNVFTATAGYVDTTTTATFAAPNTACTNYGMGHGRIHNADITNPISIMKQMQVAGSTGFTGKDLVLIDGGGNDAADLIGAYLKITSDAGASYMGILARELPPATIAAGMGAGASGVAGLGVAYMNALAAEFYTSVQTNVLSNALNSGTPRTVILNIPDVLVTPRFQLVLSAVSASAGGGAAGAAKKAAVSQVVGLWINAFNSKLATLASANSNVAVVDFYSSLDDEVANPTQYGLTNVATPACPATGVDASGLPTYTFSTCTDTYLSANPQSGATGGADWWKTYAFADNFHPTPYGHQLLAQLVSKSLALAGWL